MNNQINIAQLATPDFIRKLPEFDGNPIDLNDFIEALDSIVLIIAQAPEGVQPFWSRALKSKIVGKAKGVLKLYGNNLDWPEIRTYLISHFSDKRDERTLFAQLMLIKQNNSAVEEFYQNVLDLVGLLNNKVSAKDIINEAKVALIQTNQETGLRSFINGCRDPLKNILKARQPQTLIQAYEIAIEEQRDRPELVNYVGLNYGNRTNNNYTQNRKTNNFNNFRLNNNYNNPRNYNNNINNINRYNSNNYQNFNRPSFNSGYNFRPRNFPSYNNYQNANWNNNNSNHHRFERNSGQNRVPTNGNLPRTKQNPTPMEVDNFEQRTHPRIQYQNNRSNENRPNVIADELFSNKQNFQVVGTTKHPD